MKISFISIVKGIINREEKKVPKSNIEISYSGYYSGAIKNLTPTLSNPIGFEAAYANLKDVKVDHGTLYNHEQLVVPNGDTVPSTDYDWREPD